LGRRWADGRGRRRGSAGGGYKKYKIYSRLRCLSAFWQPGRKKIRISPKMLTIGCHLSAAKGFLDMGKTALSIGANTFQFFLRNPRGSGAKALDAADVQAFLALAQEHNLGVILAHAPYTLNACSADARVRAFAAETMADDLRRMEFIPGNMYNFHPGSHTGQGVDTGCAQIAELLNRLLRPEQTTTVLLETMAGKGSEIGGAFDELGRIMGDVALKEKIGVCLDTCHVFDAGYDIVNALDEVLERFESSIGLEALRAIHLNDSMNQLGSRKDRHAKIGQGGIALAAMARIINHPLLAHLPFFLETPNELPGYAEEISLLRSLYTGAKVAETARAGKPA
jgi:deoxyribonuclease-4